ASIRKTLLKLAERYLPSRPAVVRGDTRHDPPSIAATLDVDTLHGILDEAQSGNTQRLFAVYRDLVLGHSHGQSEVNTRKLAVVGERPVGEPDDKRDAAAVAARDLVATVWLDHPGARAAVTHLLDAALWPVSVVEKTYKPGSNGRRY